MSPRCNVEKVRHTRSSIACDACRKRKIKCSGKVPCSSCQRKSITCNVSEDSRRIIVSERYLNSLHQRARRPEHPGPSPSRSIESDALEGQPIDVVESSQNASASAMPSDEDLEEHSQEAWENDLSQSSFPNPPSFIRDHRVADEQWLYITQSSSSSFSFRVRSMLEEALPTSVIPKLEYHLDGDAYPLDWKQHLTDQASWLQGIPPQDYAVYLLNSVKFHLGHVLPLFDEGEFSRRMATFYENPQDTVRKCRIWYVEFLIVLAFGKAFLVPTQKRIAPPGFEFFSRAMALIPTVPEMQSEPLLAIEVQALTSLYMYCLDLRAAAYVHIGQATRLAMWSGLHMKLPIEKLGSKLSLRYNSLWWSIYVLDRHISSATGCPKSVPEEDITAPLPTAISSSQQHIIQTLHVKVTRLMSRVRATIYVPDDIADRTFLQRTRQVLKHLAGLARELEDTIHNQLQSPVQLDLAAVSLITLSYHECAILATRPVLLSLFHRRLKSGTLFVTTDEIRSAGVKTLVDTCAQSAAKIIELLLIRLENNMIEAFLPFQLANLTSTITILQIFPAVFTTDHNCSKLAEKAITILDDMISRGNRIAALRKKEAFHIQSLLAQVGGQNQFSPSNFHLGIGEHGISPSALMTGEQHSLFSGQTFGISEMPDDPTFRVPGTTVPSYPMVPNEDFLASFGLSSDALDCVINQAMFSTPLDLQGSWGDEDECTQSDFL